MTVLWHFYWPVFCAAMALGLVAGIIAFRGGGKRERNRRFGAGAIAALLVTIVWHGPVGNGERLAQAVERSARMTINNNELSHVTAQLERRPLRRTIVLHGPANDFQQRELLRIMDEVPGVGSVHWDRPLEPYGGL